MTIRRFIPFPDKRLRQKSSPVDKVTDETRAIWQDMLDSMYAMPGSGVGLAAVQIGVMQRLAVVDCSNDRKGVIRMANPEILHVSAKLEKGQEGSPNLPGVYADIERPRGITVSFLNEEGMRVREDYVGLWARSILHQIDHMNGKLYFDHLSSVKRKMLLSKAAKFSKKARG